MYLSQVNEINESLAKTKKAIISLGCSFVEGQGAIDQDIYDQYEWRMEETGVPMKPVLSSSQRNNLLKKYPELIYDGNGINWTFMEYKNAFVNVLCKKYFKEQYTPINFGLRGRGNRASIKSLYFWPQIDWHLIEELIVVYAPSGPERFDFINDEFKEHGQFQCMWPWWQDKPDGPRKTLWKGYNEALYSEKFGILEQLSNVVELKNWCKLNNAKLIITPGFDRSYTKDTFSRVVKDFIERSAEQDIQIFRQRDKGPTESHFRPEELAALEKIVDQWPWDNMFYPQGAETFMELCLKQEGITNKGYWDYNGVGTPNGWVTVCCHPSAKGHDLFAKELHQHIEKIKNA